MMRSAIDENPPTSLARLIAEKQAEALRAFARRQRESLEALPERDRYAVHPGRSTENWYHIVADMTDGEAERIAGQAEGGE